MSITQIRLDTQSQDATLTPAKVSTTATDDFTFPRDISATRNVLVGNGSASLPTLTFSSDTNTGFFNQAADSIGVAAGGTEYLRITPSRVQAFTHIRTSSGGSAGSPDLEIGSATTGIFNATGGSDFHITVGSTEKLGHNGVQWESYSPFRFTSGSTGVASISFTGDPDTGIYSPGANTWAVTVGGAEAFRADPTGFKTIVGAAANPSISFTSDTDTGFFDQAANSIGMAANGAEVARADTSGLKVINGSDTNPSYSFINDTNSGFALNSDNPSDQINVVLGGQPSFTFVKENATSNHQLFARVPGIVTRPVYSYYGSSTTGMYFPSSNIGFTLGGVETLELSSSTAHFIANDVQLDSDQKVILGNGGNAFVKYDSTNDFILWQQDASGTTQFTSNGEFDLYSNVGPNFTGTFSPGLEMYVDGHVFLRNDGTLQGSDGNRYVQIRFDQGVVSGFNSVLQLNRGNNDDAVFLELGYDADGVSRTGSRIRGSNLTVESLSPLNLVASSINVSSKILNQDGSAGAPGYSFQSNPNAGMYMVSSNLFFSTGGVTQLGIVNAGQLQARDGSASAPSYSFFNDTGMGAYRIGASQLGLATGGTLRFSIDGSGNTVTTGNSTTNGNVITNVVQGRTGSLSVRAFNATSHVSLTNSAGGLTSSDPYIDLNTNGNHIALNAPGATGTIALNATDAGGRITITTLGAGGDGKITITSSLVTTENSDQTKLSPGIVSAPGLVMVNTAGLLNSGFFVPADGEIAWSSAGTDILHINASGILMQGSSTIDMGGNKIVNAADPTSNQDVATKSYVDNIAAGLDPKASSRVATAAPLTSGTDYTAAGSGGSHTLTATANGVLAVDGVNSGWTDIDNDGGSRDPMAAIPASRVLVKDASVASDNGIYAVKAKGDGSHPWVLIRATDQDGTPSNEVSGGNFSFVEEGTLWADTGWTVSSNGNIVVDTDPINWIQFSAAGAIDAGAGLTQMGATINFVAGDASLTVNPDDVEVKRDPAGALGLSGAGIAVNVDGSTIEINTDAIRVKDGGITYAKTTLVTRETPTGAVDGVNTTFTLANSCVNGSEHVYLNGILMDAGGSNDYTLSGSTITFNTAPVTNSKVRVTYWKS